MSAKVKQEIASLHASVGRLKEQVVETKEIDKASQASAGDAYEARDKDVEDIEVVNLNIQETQPKSKICGRRTMQMAYDKLLADHVQLENEKEELERSRNRTSEAHQEVLVRMTELLNRYEGETTKLYGLVLSCFW
ncbi:hypothetical protein Hanom_Chr08g00717431 [Helianthus anomalus]